MNFRKKIFRIFWQIFFSKCLFLAKESNEQNILNENQGVYRISEMKSKRFFRGFSEDFYKNSEDFEMLKLPISSKTRYRTKARLTRSNYIVILQSLSYNLCRCWYWIPACIQGRIKSPRSSWWTTAGLKHVNMGVLKI